MKPPQQLPKDLDELDRQSREEWSGVMATVFIQAWTPDMLRKIVMGGEQRFIAIARPICRRQDLRTADYSHIFDLLRQAAGKGPWQKGLPWAGMDDTVH